MNLPGVDQLDHAKQGSQLMVPPVLQETINTRNECIYTYIYIERERGGSKENLK